MKAKKAVKKLEKVESILKSVMEDYSEIEPGSRRLLDNAKGLATRARAEMIHARPASKQAPKGQDASNATTRKGPGRASTKASELLADAG